MLIRHQQDVPAAEVRMPGAQGVRMRLMVGREDGAPHFAMRLFEVEPEGCTPCHSHNYEHEVMVLEGSGQVASGPDGSTFRPIKAGDVLYIPANETHQFRNVADKPLRFLCMVPVQFDCGNGQCQPTPGS